MLCWVNYLAASPDRGVAESVGDVWRESAVRGTRGRGLYGNGRSNKDL